MFKVRSYVRLENEVASIMLVSQFLRSPAANVFLSISIEMY